MLRPTPAPTLHLDKRQLWNLPDATTSTTTCAPVTIPSGGILTLNPTSTITFTTDVVFQPNCSAYSGAADSAIEDPSAPFYASTTVLIYVVATTTVVAWLLLILLLIAPGKVRARATRGRSGWLSSVVYSAPGGRPWLQKAAALLVTVGLTTASVFIFHVAHKQYRRGFMDAEAMRDEVVGSYAIRIMRVISDIFIWLAQVQTLIRLFPRHKEKLIIKWFGFMLIILDTVFSCLNSFVIDSRQAPRLTTDAIPALSYLFQLSISLLYGAWVMYYVLTKRTYAFVSKDMPNITIVMMLAVIAVLIPVGFFVADVSVPAVSGWGDFFRWVGGTAASVLVWEWVERIEVLEREEKRDGILGREIFEEDEVVSDSLPKVPRSFRSRRNSDFSDSDNGRDAYRALFNSILEKSRSLLPFGIIRRSKERDAGSARTEKAVDTRKTQELGLGSGAHSSPSGFIGPSPCATTVSREESGTPSTVYAVHYHSVANTPPAFGPKTIESANHDGSRSSQETIHPEEVSAHVNMPLRLQFVFPAPGEPGVQSEAGRGIHSNWTVTSHLFRRGKKSPPLQVKQAMSMRAEEVGSKEQSNAPHQILRRKIGRFAAGLTREGVEGVEDGRPEIVEQPTIIPAPPRGHAWSPEIMRHSPVHHHRVSAMHASESPQDQYGDRASTNGTGRIPATQSRDIVGFMQEPGTPRHLPAHERRSPSTGGRTGHDGETE